MYSNLFFFSFCLFILHSNLLVAQNITTSKDSALLIESSPLPMGQVQYTLSFRANDLNLNYERDEQANSSESIEELQQKIEKNPKDYKTSRQIVEYYRKTNNQEQFMLYFEPFYNNVYADYQSYPDSFEIVELFCELLQETQNMDGLFSVWEQFVNDNPNEKRALTLFAIQLALKGEIDKANRLTQQAYDLDINNNDVYVAALMCEFSSVLLQFNQIFSAGIDQAAQDAAINRIKTNGTFFKKAIKSKAPVSAQMALDASELMLIFYRTILSFSKKNIGKEKIILKPNSADEKILKNIEKRALAQLKKKPKNSYFAHKILCTIEMIRGNQLKAKDYWAASGSFLAQDSETLRLLSFGFFLKMDFANAIVFAEKITNNHYEDAYALGRFYAYNNELDKAFDLFGEMRHINPSDERTLCAQMSILIQTNKFNEAAELIAAVPAEATDNIDLFNLNYYKAISTLISGDKNDAFKRLKAIHAESEYKKDADNLIHHFFEQTND